VQLEGFHIRAAYLMAEKHKLKKGPHHRWVYPHSNNVLKECKMGTISHYIDVRRSTIFQYVVDWPVYDACRVGEWKRGSPPRLRWWAQKMYQDSKDADVADK
jgi:hypothetical protein